MDKEARRTAQLDAQKSQDIAQGISLECIDHIPEGRGIELRDELRQSLDTKDPVRVLATLKKIGDTLHARWGFERATHPEYSAEERKYRVNLSTGTSGTRLLINEDGVYSGDLIFPNVNLDHIKNKRTLADVFEELFEGLTLNINDEDSPPYYVVPITSKEEK
jgi:hypothetical protein